MRGDAGQPDGSQAPGQRSNDAVNGLRVTDDHEQVVELIVQVYAHRTSSSWHRCDGRRGALDRYRRVRAFAPVQVCPAAVRAEGLAPSRGGRPWDSPRHGRAVATRTDDTGDLHDLLFETEDLSERIDAEKRRGRVIDHGRDRRAAVRRGMRVLARKLGATLQGDTERRKESRADGLNSDALDRFCRGSVAAGDRGCGIGQRELLERSRVHQGYRFDVPPASTRRSGRLARISAASSTE